MRNKFLKNYFMKEKITLIIVDLPALGIPIIIVLIGRGFKPFKASFFLFSLCKIL